MQTFRVLHHDLKWVNKAYKLKRAIKVESNFWHQIFIIAPT